MSRFWFFQTQNHLSWHALDSSRASWQFVAPFATPPTPATTTRTRMRNFIAVLEECCWFWSSLLPRERERERGAGHCRLVSLLQAKWQNRKLGMLPVDYASLTTSFGVIWYVSKMKFWKICTFSRETCAMPSLKTSFCAELLSVSSPWETYIAFTFPFEVMEQIRRRKTYLDHDAISNISFESCWCWIIEQLILSP